MAELAAPHGRSHAHSCWFLHHFSVLPHNHREAKGAVLGLHIVRGTAHCAFGACDKWRCLARFAAGMRVFLHRPNNFITDAVLFSPEIASLLTGKLRLSQIAHREAKGR